MKHFVSILLFLTLPIFASAESAVTKGDKKSSEVTMSALDAVKLAGDFVESGNYDNAETILTQLPQTKSLPVEIERWFLLGQISARRDSNIWQREYDKYSAEFTFQQRF